MKRVDKMVYASLNVLCGYIVCHPGERRMTDPKQNMLVFGAYQPICQTTPTQKW